MRRFLTMGTVDENDISNEDETNFVINVDNGRTLGFYGLEELKYTEFVSEVKGFTMVVRFRGWRDDRIESKFIIFKNMDRDYHIRGRTDDVHGVTYRTGPKVWK